MTFLACDSFDGNTLKREPIYFTWITWRIFLFYRVLQSLSNQNASFTKKTAFRNTNLDGTFRKSTRKFLCWQMKIYADDRYNIKYEFNSPTSNTIKVKWTIVFDANILKASTELIWVKMKLYHSCSVIPIWSIAERLDDQSKTKTYGEREWFPH